MRGGRGPLAAPAATGNVLARRRDAHQIAPALRGRLTSSPLDACEATTPDRGCKFLAGDRILPKKSPSLFQGGDMLRRLFRPRRLFFSRKGRVLVGLGWSPAVVADARKSAAA